MTFGVHPLKPPTVDTYFRKSFIDNLPVIEVHTRIESVCRREDTTAIPLRGFDAIIKKLKRYPTTLTLYRCLLNVLVKLTKKGKADVFLCLGSVHTLLKDF